MIDNKLVLAAAMAVMTFALAACNKEQAADPAAQAAAAATAPVPLPAPGSDAAAWKKYLADVVMKNMEGVKTNRPYMYFVPDGGDEKAAMDRENQLDNVKTVVARGVLPGNMIAFGGPDSATTADLVVEAFAEGQAGTLKDVLVLFVGAEADSARVQAALATVGATYRFAEMK
mgnify:CR=1 FL=1